MFSWRGREMMGGVEEEEGENESQDENEVRGVRREDENKCRIKS